MLDIKHLCIYLSLWEERELHEGRLHLVHPCVPSTENSAWHMLVVTHWLSEWAHSFCLCSPALMLILPGHSVLSCWVIPSEMWPLLTSPASSFMPPHASPDWTVSRKVSLALWPLWHTLPFPDPDTPSLAQLSLSFLFFKERERLFFFFFRNWLTQSWGPASL